MKRNLLFSFTVIAVLTASLSAQGGTLRGGPASLGPEGDDAIERRHRGPDRGGPNHPGRNGEN